MSASSTPTPLKVNRKMLLWLPLVLTLIVLLFFTQDYLLGMLIALLSSAYLAQCWNIMGGYAGQFSFGHAAFFGIGAYTSSLLYVDLGVNPYVGTIIGAIFAGLVGLIIGNLSFRYKLRGNYFALATLAFAEMLRVLFNNAPIFKASVGVSIPFANDPVQFQFADRKAYYFIALFMLAAITCFIYFLRKSKMGYYLIALRDDEDAAAALGVNILKYKLFAIVASGALSALAGSFYAQYYSYIDASLAFGAVNSLNAIAPCIIGGSGTIFGPILGALLLTPVHELTNVYLSGLGGLNMVVYGSILILVILFFPQGIMRLIRQCFQKSDTNSMTAQGDQVC